MAALFAYAIIMPRRYRKRFVATRTPMSDDEFLRVTGTADLDRPHVLAVRSAVGKACRIPHEHILPTESLDFMAIDSEFCDMVAFVMELESILQMEISDELAAKFPSPYPQRALFRVVKPAPENFAQWAKDVVRFMHDTQSDCKANNEIQPTK